MHTHIMSAALGVSLVLAQVPVVAHHAFEAEFDKNRPVELRGTVTKMEWVNPHSWLHISVKKPDGTTEEWMLEGGTPNTLFRRGITKDSIRYGIEVVAKGFQARDGALRASGTNLTFSDGRTLFFGSSGVGAPPPDPAPLGVRTEYGGSCVGRVVVTRRAAEPDRGVSRSPRHVFCYSIHR